MPEPAPGHPLSQLQSELRRLRDELEELKRRIDELMERIKPALLAATLGVALSLCSLALSHAQTPPNVVFPAPQPIIIYPSAAPPITDEFVSIKDGHLWLASQRYTGFGVNMDQFATQSGIDNKGALTQAGKDAIDWTFDNLQLAAGVRAIRIHGLGFTTTMNIFHWANRDRTPGFTTTRKLDPVYLASFDYFWASMRKRNIRAVVTLEFRRQLVKADKPEWDCPSFDEVTTTHVPGLGIGEMVPWMCFDPGLNRLNSEFNEQFLQHVNPLTGLAIGKDPALLAVILHNETSITKTGPGGPNAYDPAKYPVLAKLWNDKLNAYVKAHGYSKPNDVKAPEWQRMLSGMEVEWLAAEVPTIRANTKALIIAGTVFGNQQYTSLASFAAVGDVMDCHFYSRGKVTETNGFTQNAGEARSRFATYTAACAWGKPLFCTEWGPVAQQNNPLIRDPDADRAVDIKALVDASIVQDIDATFLYSWGHGSLYDPPNATKHTVYDFRDDAVLLKDLPLQVTRFHDLGLRQAVTKTATIPLTPDKLWGVGVGAGFTLQGPWRDGDVSAVPGDTRVRMVIPSSN